jgi:hypothetical protein
MESFNLALKSVQGNLKEISSTISTIYKNVPDAYIPNTLREAHKQLNLLQNQAVTKFKDSSLPEIYYKHQRSKTSDDKSIRLNHLDSFSTDRESFQLKSVYNKELVLRNTQGFNQTGHAQKFSRLHSNQSYQRPKFNRISRARVVPKATRHDPVANPVKITAEEKELGLFNIVNKGLISKDTNLTEILEFPSLQSRKIALNTFSSRFQSPVAEKKLFTTALETSNNKRKIQAESPEVINIGDYGSNQTKKVKKNINSVIERYYIIVKRGKLKFNTDLINFKKNFSQKWRTMEEVLKQVEEYCKKYRYPKVIIDAQKLYSLEIDEVKPLTPEKFKKCVLNYLEINKTMKEFKVAYRGKAGKHLAAVKIQTAYRTFYAAKQFRNLRALNAKARFIQLYFRLYLQKLETKKSIKGVRQERLEQFQIRQKAFKEAWPSIKLKKRIEIHLGSLNPDPTQNFYYARQNAQLMRVFSLSDTNISIIYISPVPLHSDITEYYYSVLNLCQIPDVRTRLTFITPNHGISLKSQYSASKLLFLASNTISEIKDLIKDKIAYIVPNQVTDDDIWLTDLLGIPLMCGDPTKTNVISTKLGCIDVFQKSSIKTPVFISGITSPDVFYKKFATAVYENIYKDTWIMKINHESRSRGIAYIDVSKLKSVIKLRKLDGLKEEHLTEIHGEMTKLVPSMVKIVMVSLWESWNSFLIAFCSYGGIIQETPNLRSNIASVCISIYIEPDETIQYLCAVDRMQSREYLNTGMFFPQSSLPSSEILEISLKVGKELYSEGIFGHACIELIAFPDPYNDGGLPIYWGIGIKLAIGIITSSYLMFHVLVGGTYDILSGKYYIEFEEQEDEFTIVEDLFGDNLTNLLTTSKPTRNRSKYAEPSVIKLDNSYQTKNFEDFNKFDERCYFFCWHVEHPDLRDLSIGGLFHMCRLESMTYSLETCKGSVFSIYETLDSHHFGIMGIGNNRQDSIRVLSETFTFILQQAGPPPQPSLTFKPPPREDVNLNELITKVKSIHKTLEKISKSGKKNYLVELL